MNEIVQKSLIHQNVTYVRSYEFYVVMGYFETLLLEASKHLQIFCFKFVVQSLWMPISTTELKIKMGICDLLSFFS